MIKIFNGEVYNFKEEREILTDRYISKSNIQTQLLNHILLGYDNVIITPHNAFHSHEALLMILDTTVGNIRSYFENKPQNVVQVSP